MNQSPCGPHATPRGAPTVSAALWERLRNPAVSACCAAIALFACSGVGAENALLYCIHNATERDLLFRVFEAPPGGQPAIMEQWISGGEEVCDVNRGAAEALLYAVYSAMPDIGGCSLQSGTDADLYLTYYGGQNDCRWHETRPGGEAPTKAP